MNPNQAWELWATMRDDALAARSGEALDLWAFIAKRAGTDALVIHAGYSLIARLLGKPSLAEFYASCLLESYRRRMVN